MQCSRTFLMLSLVWASSASLRTTAVEGSPRTATYRSSTSRGSNSGFTMSKPPGCQGQCMCTQPAVSLLGRHLHGWLHGQTLAHEVDVEPQVIELVRKIEWDA